MNNGQGTIVSALGARHRAVSEEAPAGYKRTKVGVIPEDWESSSIRAIASPTRNAIVGGPFGSDLVSKDYMAHGVPVIRGQNMSGRWVSGSFVFVTPMKAKSLEANLAHTGDIVFTQRGTLGQVSLVPDKPFSAYLVSQSQMKLSVNRKVADPLFLYYFFTSYEQQNSIQGRTIQTGVPHINLGILCEIPVRLPPLSEQHAIAEALSDVDGLLAALEALIAKKQAIKQAAMQQLLTGKIRMPSFNAAWNKASMRQIGLIYGGLSGKNKNDFGTGNARYVTFLNVLENVIVNTQDTDRVRVALGERQNAVLKGDLLFNGTSETPSDLATGAIVSGQTENLYLNSFCFGFRIHDGSKYDPLFLAYYFRAPAGRAVMSALAQGATRYNLSKHQFLSLELPVPVYEEQRAVAAVFSDMDKEIASLEQRQHKTRAIKKGMMQQLLTGRVRLPKSRKNANQFAA